MTKVEAIEHLKDILDDVPNDKCIDWIEALNKAIEVLRQEPCEDAISRQAVLNLIEHYNSDGLGSVFYGYEEGVKFANAVNRLPSVIPQPKTGHWIELGYVGNDNYDFECSECHHTDTHSKTVKVNYCWCCGTKMEVEE